MIGRPESVVRWHNRVGQSSHLSGLLDLLGLLGLLDLMDGLDYIGPRPSWTTTYVDLVQDLKDFARQSSLDVVYSETGRDSNGRG